MTIESILQDQVDELLKENDDLKARLKALEINSSYASGKALDGAFRLRGQGDIEVHLRKDGAKWKAKIVFTEDDTEGVGSRDTYVYRRDFDSFGGAYEWIDIEFEPKDV